MRGPEKMFRYLPSGSCGTPLGIVGALPQGARQRNPRSNLRAMRHLRHDRQVAPHQSQALAHANQAEAHICLSKRRVKPSASVRNTKIDSIATTRQFYLNFRRPAVFYNVSQRFLHDSKETEAYVLRDLFRNVLMNKLHSKVVLQ